MIDRWPCLASARHITSPSSNGDCLVPSLPSPPLRRPPRHLLFPLLVSPVLRRHITLPHATRRLGRRSYHTPGSPAPESLSDTPAAAPNAVDGSSSHGGGGGGNADGNWELASPPDILGTRVGFDVGANNILGLEPEFTGEAGGGEGGGVGEGIRGCAEWAMSFSGDLKQGMTTVKVRRGRL